MSLSSAKDVEKANLLWVCFIRFQKRHETVRIDVNGPLTLDNSSSSRPRSEVAHQPWQVFGIHHDDCDDTITRSSDEPLSNMSVVLTVTRMAELGSWNFSGFRRDDGTRAARLASRGAF